MMSVGRRAIGAGAFAVAVASIVGLVRRYGVPNRVRTMQAKAGQRVRNVRKRQQ